jgi:hypothetical protein
LAKYDRGLFKLKSGSSITTPPGTRTIYIPIDGGVSKVDIVNKGFNVVKEGLGWCPDLDYRLPEDEAIKATGDDILFLIIILSLKKLSTESIEGRPQEINDL